MRNEGVHEYSSNSIFPHITFNEIHVTKIPIALIFIIQIHYITQCLYFRITIYPLFYFFKSLFDIIFILLNHYLTYFLLIRIIILHNFYISELLFRFISDLKNFHVTERPFDLKLIRMKNNGVKIKCSQSEFIKILIANFDWLHLIFAPLSVLYSSHKFKFISCILILKLKSIFFALI